MKTCQTSLLSKSNSVGFLGFSSALRDAIFQTFARKKEVEWLMMVFRSLCKTDCKKVNWAKQMFFLCSIYMFWLFLINVEISLLRQLYSRNRVLFNLTISGNDAFSAMCNVYLQSGLFIPLKPSIADKPMINLPFPVVETVKEHLLWCTAIGTPPIQVKLFKDNIPLASGIGRVIFRPNKTATYTCFANNSFGTDSREFQVTLSGKYSTGPSSWMAD